MQIGNDNFAWLGTTHSKQERPLELSRSAACELHRTWSTHAALRYMHECARSPVDHRAPGNEFDTFTARVPPTNWCVADLDTAVRRSAVDGDRHRRKHTRLLYFDAHVDDIAEYFIGRVDVLLSTCQIAEGVPRHSPGW